MNGDPGFLVQGRIQKNDHNKYDNSRSYDSSNHACCQIGPLIKIHGIEQIDGLRLLSHEGYYCARIVPKVSRCLQDVLATQNLTSGKARIEALAAQVIAQVETRERPPKGGIPITHIALPDRFGGITPIRSHRLPVQDGGVAKSIMKGRLVWSTPRIEAADDASEHHLVPDQYDNLPNTTRPHDR